MSDDDLYDHPDDICRPGDGCDPAPPLSPREREIVDRFETAPDGLLEDDLCDCGSGATRAECDPAYGGGSNVRFIACTPDGVVTTYYDDGTWSADIADGA